jgi:hypothetical protein
VSDAQRPPIHGELAPDTQLTSYQLSDTLTEHGYKTSVATLNSKACLGSGPPYRLYGRQRVYRWGDVIDWLDAMLGEPASSATEHRARKAAKKLATK